MGESWVSQWQGGPDTGSRRLRMLEDLLSPRVLPFLKMMGTGVCKQCLRVVYGREVKEKVGKGSSTDRDSAITGLQKLLGEMRDAMREEGKMEAPASSEDDTSEEDDSDGEGEEGEEGEGEELQERKRTDTPPPTRTSVRPPRSARKSQIAADRLGKLSKKSMEAVLRFAHTPSLARELIDLTTAEREALHALRLDTELKREMLAAMPASTTSSTASSASPSSLPRVDLEPSSVRRALSASASLPSPEPGSIPPQEAERIRRDTLRHLLSVSAAGSIPPPSQPLPGTSSTSSSVSQMRLLERLGVSPELRELEPSPWAQLWESAGQMPLEQWWLSQQQHITRSQGGSAVFYEGLLLCLLLDQQQRLEVWRDLAARRLLSLRLVVEGVPWDGARAFLPLQSRAGLSAETMNAVLRYQHNQQQLHSALSGPYSSYSHDSPPHSSAGYRRGGRGRGGRGGRGRGEPSGDKKGKSGNKNSKDKQGSDAVRETVGAENQ